MSYISGGRFDYNNAVHFAGAAECLADIHSISIKNASGLISYEHPLKAILKECEAMAAVYTDSEPADKELKFKIRKMLDKAWLIAGRVNDVSPYKCCINTELNSSNFIAHDDKVSLVDWEKPLYGDPAQDLGHFLAPTTTLWKTDTVYCKDKMDRFITEYEEFVAGRFTTEGLRKRTHQFIIITCMRGITWCAMAWVQYINSAKKIINDDTMAKLDMYMSKDFLDYIDEYMSSYYK